MLTSIDENFQQNLRKAKEQLREAESYCFGEGMQGRGKEDDDGSDKENNGPQN